MHFCSMLQAIVGESSGCAVLISFSPVSSEGLVLASVLISVLASW